MLFFPYLISHFSLGDVAYAGFTVGTLGFSLPNVARIPKNIVSNYFGGGAAKMLLAPRL